LLEQLSLPVHPSRRRDLSPKWRPRMRAVRRLSAGGCPSSLRGVFPSPIASLQQPPPVQPTGALTQYALQLLLLGILCCCFSYRLRTEFERGPSFEIHEKLCRLKGFAMPSSAWPFAVRQRNGCTNCASGDCWNSNLKDLSRSLRCSSKLCFLQVCFRASMSFDRLENVKTKGRGVPCCP